MLLKLIKEQEPIYMTVALDSKTPTFRKELYPDYKATRKPPPPDLVKQIPKIQEIVEAYGIPIAQCNGFEADDVIATCIKKAQSQGLKTIIVSGDKDLLQLISPDVIMFDPKQNKIYDQEKVKKKYGLSPSQIPDMMALAGDSSDNIPGVKGIGQKGAIKLIQKYRNLDMLLNSLDSITPLAQQKAILAHKKEMMLSKELVSLRDDVPIALSSFKIKKTNKQRLKEIFQELEFYSFLKDLLKEEALLTKEYSSIFSKEKLQTLLSEIQKRGEFCIDLETTGLDPNKAEIVGIALTYQQNKGWYIPVAHSYQGSPPQLKREYVLNQLKPYLEDPKIKKYGQNIKYDDVVLRKYGIIIKGVAFDTMIASYLLDPERQHHNLEQLALVHLNYPMITYKEVTSGSKKKQLPFEKVLIEKATEYSCEDTDITFILTHKFIPKIEEQRLKTLMYEVELPLSHVLADMESTGIRVDLDHLRELSRKTSTKLKELESQIYDLCGERFNINSTQQLSEILFKKLKLPVKRKTKTGYSTDSEVLSELKDHHPVPGLVLSYRTISKLKSTYIDALPKAVNLRTQRVHTCYNQAVAATGRLSSSDPNLQNIPVRTDLGREIRKAFVPEKGWWLLSADYSQIELRILAHLSEDPMLLESFLKGEDVHKKTAAEIFGVSLEQVTPEMRTKAKAINFGVIYGQTEYGLAKELGISPKEAASFIEAYFLKYKKVKEFMNKTIEIARKDQSVTTLLGRKRPISNINSENHKIRSMAERMARNTPIQGTAADLIKLSMIKIHSLIDKMKLLSRMLLTVHDELVFEVPEQEIDIMKELTKTQMEKVWKLKVPLKVDISVGKSWFHAH
jgi:DNA polymerase-1